MIAAAKPLCITKPAVMARQSVSVRKASRVVVRAEPEKAQRSSEPMTNEDGTVFYGGKTFASEAEWKAAVENGSVAQAAPAAPAAAAVAAAPGFSDLMAFSGPAPEIINSRLSMIAIVAALGAELSSGQSVLRQWSCEPTAIILTAVTFTVASLIPMFNNTKREAFGPFTPEAEITNGRAAMLGFASLLIFEAFKGSALF